jgi:D-alanine-D-alanine ligase-like ATP-grasp enzyme
MRYPFASRIIEKIAPALGIKVELEPEFGFAGELILPNGRRHLFKNTNFNINPAGSHDIAKDKAYTKFFLQKHGFKVPQGKTFFSEKLNRNIESKNQRSAEKARDYAQSIGYPVFIKPNHLSQGELVCKAYNNADLLNFAQQIFEVDHVLLVEQTCIGADYRVVVLDDQVISAYERCPLSVEGDSVHTINELLQLAKSGLQHQNRPNSEIQVDDQRIDVRLRELGITRTTVLAKGHKEWLLDNANLSTGGSSVDVTETIHPSFKKIAIDATAAMGLRLAGVDILCPNLANDAQEQPWVIIEMNASPGLDNYAALGAKQQARVEDLYRKILLAL